MLLIATMFLVAGIVIYSFIKGKDKSISWVLGKINLIISLLIFIPYSGFYFTTAYFFYRQGKIFPKESGMEALPLALITGILAIVGQVLLIPVVIGIIIAIADLFSKKKSSSEGLKFNLLSGLFWVIFYVVTSFIR